MMKAIRTWCKDCLSGSIAAPSRSSPLAAVIVLLVVGVLTVAMAAPRAVDSWGLALLVLLLVLSIVIKAAYAIHMLLFALVRMAWVKYFPHFQWWPFYLLVPLLVYGAAVIVIAPLRCTVGFACLNAAMEEILFRGIMLEALDSALGETIWTVGIQSAAFAAFHYLAGFPNGLLGVLMVFVYGLMLGMIRRRARGMLAPWVAHVVADITIFATLVVILAWSG